MYLMFYNRMENDLFHLKNTDFFTVTIVTNKYINLYILYLGDLLPIGQIKSVGSGMIFSNPSAWAIHCKKSVNPAKRSGMLRVLNT